MRFNLDHAVSAISCMCSVQEHALDMVSLKCLWLVVSLRTTLFISREGERLDAVFEILEE